MSFTTRYEPRENYLECNVEGDFELESFFRLIDEVVQIAKQQRHDRALVDARAVRGDITTYERYQIGVYFADRQAEAEEKLRLSFVALEPVVDSKRFGETVARNRGADARVFTDLEEAIGWLLKNA